MEKIKVGIEILKYLSSQTRPVSAREIVDYLNDSFELDKDIKYRTIQQNLRELAKELTYTQGGIQAPIIKSIKGVGGGWSITKEGREEIKQLSSASFDKDTLNAINDSFQRAMVSETFYYKEDLKKAKGILYSAKNFHEYDHEHYLGNSNEIIKSEVIKRIKQVAIENKYAIITFKHLRYGITEKEMELKVIRLIHDLDESFVICTKRGNFEPIYINIRNIAKIKIGNGVFSRKHEPSFASTINEDKSSVKIRTSQWAKIKVNNPRMYEVIDLWAHGCSFEYSKDKKTIMIRSNEHYRLMIFLFRTIGCATIIDAHEMIKERWNKKIDRIERIK